MRVANVVVAVGIVVGLTACSGSPTASPHPGEGTASITSPAPSAAPSTPSTQPAEQPILRAPAVPFTRTVSYRDGVLVAVTKAVKGRVTGTGPGVLTGTQTATFTLRFINHTRTALDLHHVLVLATYGSAHTPASPVYDAADIQDFATAVPAGRTAVTRYQFAVPAKALGNVVLEVRFDSNHSPALFKGPVTITKD